MEVPAAISSVSLRSTPRSRPAQMVKTKVAMSVSAMMPMSIAPTSTSWETVNCSPSRTNFQHIQIIRMENVTPSFAQAGVPMRLWNPMPIVIARIIGLKPASPGRFRRPIAEPAIAAVSKRPGQNEDARRRVR